MIPFNKPYLSGKETEYIEQAVASGKISGNGTFTQKCQNFFEKRYQIQKCLMTTSCTDALEMCALLLNIKSGDEVIVPSYTFVSSALAFVREGAKIVFADSESATPNIDANQIENLITPKTKAIVVVHYAGVACDMEKIIQLANKYGIFVVEDAAQGIESYYKYSDGRQKALGSIGHLSAFSFHETKNIISGEGGMLGINAKEFIERSEIIWEKGTNRSQFFRGEINKYGWVDTGSSFLPSEIISAFLWAQLENLEDIQRRRIDIWNRYYHGLEGIENIGIDRPKIPEYATNNAHMFYLIFQGEEHRDSYINKLKKINAHAVFHYLALHQSEFYNKNQTIVSLPNAERYEECLLRLPFYYELKESDQNRIINQIK